MNSFQERILYIRNIKLLTQKQMAERLKLTPAHISNLENGRRSPSDIIILTICNEFDVNETWLRTGEGDPFFNPRAAMQKTFAAYFIEICAAFSPVYSAYGEIIPLFENPHIMRMFNYIALRVQRGGMNKRNIEALVKCFDASFPGYEDVIMALEVKAELNRKTMLSTPIARSVKAGQKPPLDDSDD